MNIQPGNLFTGNQIFSFNEAGTCSINRLLDDALTLSKTLPEQRYLINLCEDRYLFSVVFVATIIKEQVTLLPSSQHPSAIEAVVEDYPDCHLITDKDDVKSSVSIQKVTKRQSETSGLNIDFPKIPDDRLICISFTSGSTGKPQANKKFWKTLSLSTEYALNRFGLNTDTNHSLVCTVPAQHMYGLETSVLYPLLGKVSIHSGKPFFAEDIKAALESANRQRVLITTPIHLKACVNSSTDWPEIDFIISATAPLSKQLAKKAESVMGTRVMEIFGCTETGSIASRRTVESDIWTLYDGMTVDQTASKSCAVKGNQFNAPVILQDAISIMDPTSFKLLGRTTDMVNIGGKRASLADLNIKLNNINGVIDGVYLPQQNDEEASRMTALVVAPFLSEEEILKHLRAQLDPIFLPRPLLKVKVLPRNATGKLPTNDLLRCYEQASLA